MPLSFSAHILSLSLSPPGMSSDHRRSVRGLAVFLHCEVWCWRGPRDPEQACPFARPGSNLLPLFLLFFLHSASSCGLYLTFAFIIVLTPSCFLFVLPLSSFQFLFVCFKQSVRPLRALTLIWTSLSPSHLFSPSLLFGLVQCRQHKSVYFSHTLFCFVHFPGTSSYSSGQLLVCLPNIYKSKSKSVQIDISKNEIRHFQETNHLLLSSYYPQINFPSSLKSTNPDESQVRCSPVIFLSGSESGPKSFGGLFVLSICLASWLQRCVVHWVMKLQWNLPIWARYPIT